MPEEQDLPTAEQAARRAFALAAVTCRGSIEQNASDPGAENFRLEVLRWLETAGVTSALEPQELEILKAPLGTLSERQEQNAGWRAEGLGVLAWALYRWDLDDFDVPSDAPAIAEALGFMEPEGLEWLKSPTLRPKLERAELARELYLVHRRLRQVYDRRPGPGKIRQLASELKVDATRLKLVEDDLVIGDVRLSEAPPGSCDIPSARSRSGMRLRTGSWETIPSIPRFPILLKAFRLEGMAMNERRDDEFRAGYALRQGAFLQAAVGTGMMTLGLAGIMEALALPEGRVDWEILWFALYLGIGITAVASARSLAKRAYWAWMASSGLVHINPLIPLLHLTLVYRNSSGGLLHGSEGSLMLLVVAVPASLILAALLKKGRPALGLPST